MFGFVAAMEIVPTKKIVESTEKEKWFIDVDNKIITDCMEGGGSIRYDNEYKSREFRHDIVSFPVECTDPLPIQYCGNKRFFITSAYCSSGLIAPGGVYTILDPAIKQLAIVRGALHINNNHRVDLYLGLKTDSVKLLQEGHKKIYSAELMAYQMKMGNRYYRCYISDKVEPFGVVQIIEEVKNKFPQVENRDLNDYLFRFLFKKLLGIYAQNFNFETQQFYFQKCYWPEKENK